MRDVIESVAKWISQGSTFALATVVSTSKSAPRPAGASMAVSADGEAVGSVSGGCVEGAVYQIAQEVIENGVPVLQRFGFSDNDALAVGLTCGGIIDVYIERITVDDFALVNDIINDIQVGKAVATATVIDHPNSAVIGRRLLVRSDATRGSLGDAKLDNAVSDDAQGLLASGETGVLLYGQHGERMETGTKVFISSYQPNPRMIIFGAIDFAAAVAKAGALVGFHVTVCDARRVFATRARFPAAHEVIVSWPHVYLQQEVDNMAIDNRTVICVLTHDPKFDVPVLDIALRLEGNVKPAYIGAMGSRKTHDDRTRRLYESGLVKQQLEELHSPIGLDLGGRTPEETAISILAEIISKRWHGTGHPLRDTSRPVHSHEFNDNVLG